MLENCWIGKHLNVSSVKLHFLWLWTQHIFPVSDWSFHVSWFWCFGQLQVWTVNIYSIVQTSASWFLSPMSSRFPKLQWAPVNHLRALPAEDVVGRAWRNLQFPEQVWETVMEALHPRLRFVNKPSSRKGVGYLEICRLDYIKWKPGGCVDRGSLCWVILTMLALEVGQFGRRSLKARVSLATEATQQELLAFTIRLLFKSSQKRICVAFGIISWS